MLDQKLLTQIIDGNHNIILAVSAADLREIITAMALQERRNIDLAIEKHRERPTLSRAQVAEMMGVHVNTVDGWARSGYLEPVKVGSKVMYRASDIDDMLDGPAATAARAAKRKRRV